MCFVVGFCLFCFGFGFVVVFVGGCGFLFALFDVVLVFVAVVGLLLLLVFLKLYFPYDDI